MSVGTYRYFQTPFLAGHKGGKMPISPDTQKGLETTYSQSKLFYEVYAEKVFETYSFLSVVSYFMR